jgi:hypothetical protein
MKEINSQIYEISNLKQKIATQDQKYQPKIDLDRTASYNTNRENMNDRPSGGSNLN